MESDVDLVWVKKVHSSSFPLYAVLLLEFRNDQSSALQNPYTLKTSLRNYTSIYRPH